MLPTLNEMIAAAKGPGAFYRYSKLKRRWTDTIHLLAKANRLPIIVPGTHIQFDWICVNKRYDPDNICGAGRKLILDGLVNAGALATDGWKARLSWSDAFLVDPKKPGTLLTFSKD